jgi:amicyanin
MIMRKVLLFIAFLMFLAACRPQDPSVPVQPVVMPPQQVVEPPIVISQPSESIEKIEISPSVDADPVQGQIVNVDIQDFSFQPNMMKIKVGDTVVWTQHDRVKHNVEIVSGPETFKAPLLNAGETFSHTFTIPGEYGYKCTPHPRMRGKVIVE